MEQHISQDEIRRIISDMVKKRNVFVKPNADMPAYMLKREKRRMSIYVGKELVEVISDTIASSKILVFVSSKHSKISKWTVGSTMRHTAVQTIGITFRRRKTAVA